MKLLYYFVPTEYIHLDDKLKKVLKIDLSSWGEIEVADSLKDYYKIPFRDRISTTKYFIEKTDEAAKFIWDLKTETEEISLKKRLSRFKNEYIIESIQDHNLLADKLFDVVFQNKYHAFIFSKNNVMTKFIYIDQGEKIEIFFDKNETETVELENIVKKWAQKTDYETFQLGLD